VSESCKEGFKHHWIIDAKNFGVCKYCGDTKQFPGIEDIQDVNTWRARHHADEDPVEGGSDMADKPSSELAGLELDEARERVEQQRDGKEGTAEEQGKAEQAGVELKKKSKKELKRRRHDPNGKVKKIPCTWPGCPYECDPRALHLHLQLQHGRQKHKTPERIVRRILELFDAGTPQVEIIAALKLQNNFELTSPGICGILNRERPDRAKKSHQRRASVDQKPKEIDKKVDPNAQLLEVVKLIVDEAPPEQVYAKALEIKNKLVVWNTKLLALSSLIEGILRYVNVIIEMGDVKLPKP
jgi:hypothetical protein